MTYRAGKILLPEIDDTIPDGGTTGQALVKASNADQDTAWGTITSVPARLTATATTTSLAAGATDSVTTITLPLTARILSFQCDHPAWVRIYPDAATQTADARTDYNVWPSSSASAPHLQFRVLTNATFDTSPVATVASMDGSTSRQMKVRNEDSVTRTITITLTYQEVGA